MVREPYGVWGGFSEADRLRLLAVGWEDAADRGRYRVDVSRLEARLNPRAKAPAQRQAVRARYAAERRRALAPA